jgi:hypothetical protein
VDFKEYIQGNKYGKSANQLEREALSDHFLQDAIDGYDAIGGDFSNDLNELEKRLRKKVNVVPEQAFNYKKFFSVAAVILLLIIGIGGGIYLVFFDKNDLQTFVGNKDDVASQSEDIVALDAKEIIEFDELIPFEEAEADPKTDVVFSEINDNEQAFYDEATSTSIELETEYEASILENEMKLEPVVATTIDDNAAVRHEVSETVPVEDQANSFYVDEIDGIVTDQHFTQKETETIPYGEAGEEQTYIGFGTTEFLQYFEENRKQNICDDSKAEVVINFVIDAQGRPSRLFVKKNTCDELRKEIIKFLNKSPQWSQQKGAIDMTIEINNWN